jgi:hypothetical protein
VHGVLALFEVTPTVSSIPVQTEKKKTKKTKKKTKNKKKTMIRH